MYCQRRHRRRRRNRRISNPAATSLSGGKGRGGIPGLFLFHRGPGRSRFGYSIMRDFDKLSGKPAHRYAWLWELLKDDPTFVLKSMFGAKAAYIDDKMQLCFMAKKEDLWRGVLVGTNKEHHDSLVAEFPALEIHPVIPKWLYLSENADAFESVAQRLVKLVQRRDPRIRVEASTKKKRVGGRGSKN